MIHVQNKCLVTAHINPSYTSERRLALIHIGHKGLTSPRQIGDHLHDRQHKRLDDANQQGGTVRE